MDMKSFALTDSIAGKTLNELSYKDPDVIEGNRLEIAFQLGMYAAFSYVFGLKDGYQTNYIFNPDSRKLIRIDKERFLDIPEIPEDTLEDNDKYTQEIAACELVNLKYIPSYRGGERRLDVVRAFNSGFLEKYREMKKRKNELIDLVKESRASAYSTLPDSDLSEYENRTTEITSIIEELISLSPKQVLKRLYTARSEL